MTGEELAARVTSARAALGDFRREGLDALASGPEPDWASWAHRLAAQLAWLWLVDALAVTLDAAQLETVLDALDDAVELRHGIGGRECADCDAHPAGLCEDHAADLGRADRYAATARQLRMEARR